MDETALLVAARLGHINCLRLLLLYGAKVTAQDNLLNNALHLAFAVRHLGISRLLLQAQPDLLESKNVYQFSPSDIENIEKQNSEYKTSQEFDNPLKMAINKKNSIGIKECLKLGADPDIKMGPKTALCHLINGRKPELVELLLEFGAGLDTPNSNGETPIFEAFQTTQYDLLLSFLKLGADPNIKNIFGQTLLINAVKKQDLDTLKMLLDFNVNVNLTDKAGHSALFYSLSHSKTDIAQLLLEHKADATQKLMSGKPILQIVEESKNKDLFALFKLHQSQPKSIQNSTKLSNSFS